MQKKVIPILILLIGVAYLTFYLNTPKVSSATTFNLTLNASTCASLIVGQNATQTFIASTCSINSSQLQSPFFLTNSSTTLVIPPTVILTFSSGFGVANYGLLNNTGTIIQKVPFINYGQVLNFKSWSIQSTFVQLNTTGANVLTSGFTTNELTGTITITSTGFLYNSNRILNSGTISNSGLLCDHLGGLLQNGTVTGNAVLGTGVSLNC